LVNENIICHFSVKILKRKIFFLAAQKNLIDMATLLISKGAEVNLGKNDGTTPLMFGTIIYFDLKSL
jgi:ankyrin repeat protein